MQSCNNATRFKNARRKVLCKENSTSGYVSIHEPCGSLCVARVKELPVILEFTSFQDTIMFHKRGRFGLEKVQNSEINVKVVLDMECGNI